MTPSKPVAEGLWTDEAEPRLIAGRRLSDGELVFPMPSGAAGKGFEPVALPRHGTLWSWTSQSFRPKSPPYGGPEAFEPYAVGYVQLGDALIVEGRLTRLENLEIGMDMELRLIPFGDVVTYAFAPAGAA
jgi:uncharacterized OB-fold protein